MNILLFDESDRCGDHRICLSDHRLINLQQVQHARPGDIFKVGKVNGQMGSATLLSIDQERAELQIDLNASPPVKLPLTLVVALPRPKMLRRILRAVAEFGVDELHLINSYRVEKSFWQTPVLQSATVRHYLLQGLEQSLDTVLPEVICHRRFKPFVEDQLPHLTQHRRALLAHPGNHPDCPRQLGRQPGLAVIGPEGGFSDYEVDKLQLAGCEVVNLGPRILRVENAVTALIARLY